MNIKPKLAQELEEWADVIEQGKKLVCPDEMNCASVMRFAAKTILEHEDPDIQIDEWNGLTDKHKVVLIRHAPNWTTLQLIEEVETMLKELNK
jgi:hypothetical protein